MKRNIGKQRHLMTLNLRHVEQGEGGTHRNLYHPVGPIFGEIKPLKPKEVLMAMGQQIEVTHRILVAYDTRVAPYMRLTYGQRNFDICSIVNENELNRQLTLYCKEKVEGEG